VPIYCGAPDVDRDFCEQAFIHYTGDNFIDVLDVVDRLDRDADRYMDMLARPKLAAVPRPEFSPGVLETRVDAIADQLRLRMNQPMTQRPPDPPVT
jgi:hypothetical protein